MKLTTFEFVTTLSLLLLPSCTDARPGPAAASIAAVKAAPGAIEVPLQRLTKRTRTREEFLAKATFMKEKYGFDTTTTTESRSNRRRRAAGSVTMTAFQDAEYVGTISIGTPAESHSVILDTGSADLIMAADDCTGCASTTNGYSATASSSSASTSTSFSITYGSGSASGTLVKDNVTIAGYTVDSQIFASCSKMNNIVAGNISGLLGLGWQSLSTSGAVPLVQALANSGDLPAKVFGFRFRSYAYDKLTSDYMAGGKMTVGGTDTSAYSGDINWVNIDSSKTYWQIPLDAITVEGTDVGISVDDVVIDTGTTLIGAPAAAVAAIYAQISGAKAISLSGSSGYYSIPCNGNFNVAFTFGNVSYAIPSDAFNAGQYDASGNCLGAIFSLTSGSASSGTSSSSLQWIIGDAFLTGVYSAFRLSSPSAVGFATLGSGGTAVAGSNSSSSTDSSSNKSTTSGSIRSASSSTVYSFAFAFGLVSMFLFA
ncbi:BQ2448_591 [Microbotryum intermedium]|uniref:BQ2448_591 protein n=1 Tax=Microbotryum intermedium TaxID=269621 RepID=A0A238F2V5_9BASI|nr:BQ2448_591 [Microbotryum intermedium]